jgi:hypothetical protein
LGTTTVVEDGGGGGSVVTTAVEAGAGVGFSTTVRSLLTEQAATKLQTTIVAITACLMTTLLRI